MSNRRRGKLRLPSLHGLPRLSEPEKDRPGERAVMAADLPPAGAINAYVCRICYKLTIVQHVDKGATPMFLTCLASETCEGQARSMMYPNQAEIPEKVRKAVRWEWYRPGKAEFARLPPEMQDHVFRGGLVLRKKV